MPLYFINRRDLPPLQVAYEGTPPCLWCGEPVVVPSMDGPLVCSLCDCGLVQDEGGVRRWSNSEYQNRLRHFQAVLSSLDSVGRTEDVDHQ